MKLFLKRVPRTVEVTALDDPEVRSYQADDYQERPLALFTEDGELLPCQTSVTTESLPGRVPTVTVTFFLDGKDVKVVGDD